MSYLLFVWSPAGYELREQEGDPPQVGDEVDVDGRSLLITKVGASPLPDDERVCAYSSG
jgi:hypothetical protein